MLNTSPINESSLENILQEELKQGGNKLYKKTINESDKNRLKAADFRNLEDLIRLPSINVWY